MTLKPCPFAHDMGAYGENEDRLELIRTDTPHVHCAKCGTAGPWVDVDCFETQEAAEAKAVELWNARGGESVPTRGN